MYLSQLILNLRSRAARFDLSDRFELHRTLLRAFPESLPEDERILFRVEDMQKTPVVPVMVQSREQPDWARVERLNSGDYLCRPPQVRPIAPSALSGDRMRFRLQANPSVKRDGKRHAIYAEEALREWLDRKSAAHGFEVKSDHLVVVKLGRRFGKKRQQTWHAVQYEGTLTVIDDAAFVDTLMRGIGSGKAFGFGLLSIPYAKV